MPSKSSPEDYTIGQETHISRSPLNLIYASQGFSGPYPDFSDGRTRDRISDVGSAPVVKISSSLVVKYRPHVKAAEAESLLFIEQKAPGVLAPCVCAYYTIGPFDRDPDDFGSIYDTYIIMTIIEGHRLDKVWNDWGKSCKASIAAQLRTHMQEIRLISQNEGPQNEGPQNEGPTIGSVSNGPLQDPIFASHSLKGPFANEQEFNAALVSIHEMVMSKAHLRYHIEGALAQNRHNVVLTHGDLQGRNIMVSGDRITGILDWETCGWYPEYLEFAKCFSVFGWPKDWPEFVLQVLEPYYCQWVVYDLIKRHVW